MMDWLIISRSLFNNNQGLGVGRIQPRHGRGGLMLKTIALTLISILITVGLLYLGIVIILRLALKLLEILTR